MPCRAIPVRWSVAVAAFTFVLPADLPAQQVRRDPATGHYFVTVYDDNRQPVEILVEAAGLVDFAVVPEVRPTPAGFRYTYSVTVVPGSPQSLATFLLDCPDSVAFVRGLAATALGDGDELWAELAPWANLPTCFVEFGALPLRPSERMRLEFESPLLPEIGESRGIGAVRGVSWPTSDPIPENDEALEFVRSIQGFTGGWKAVPTLVPTRDPSRLDDPASAVPVIRTDIDRACGQLGWITNAGVCRSLQAKLDAAARSIDRSNAASARGQLQAFLQELEAQHGPQPGKHVGANAYSLLKTNVEYVLGRLQRESSRGIAENTTPGGDHPRRASCFRKPAPRTAPEACAAPTPASSSVPRCNPSASGGTARRSRRRSPGGRSSSSCACAAG